MSFPGHGGSGGRRAVFLDRDGTVNVERGYVHRAEEFELIPGAAEAIRDLRAAGFVVVVVSNQSGVARGYYSEEAVELLHRHMDQVLALAGAAVDGYYYCPHHPEHGVGEHRRECLCRKPFPGMLLRAAEDMGIDLAASFMIGDKVADVEAALAAGCRPVLVETGHGKKEAAGAPPGTPVVKDLAAAAEEVLRMARQA